MTASQFKQCAPVDLNATKLEALLPNDTTRLHAIFEHLRQLRSAQKMKGFHGSPRELRG